MESAEISVGSGFFVFEVFLGIAGLLVTFLSVTLISMR